MRKLIVILLILVIPLAGCINKQPEPDKKQIEFWTIQLSNYSGYINNVIAEYENKHPDVKVKWVDVPFSEAEKRALAAVLSSKVPDLINMNTDFGETLASKGALLDITPLISQQEYDNYIEPAWLASSMDNFIYGVPWYITSAVTIYNKDIWHGSPPASYFELDNIAKKIDKYVMMPSLTENGQMLKMFHRYDIPIVNREKSKALFNTPDAERLLLFWKTMYDKGYIPRESITEGHRESLEKFMAGETAFIVAGENFINIIRENSPEVYRNIGIAPQLTGSNNKADFALMNFVIPKKSKYPKEALAFALFITNADNQQKFSRLTGVMSSQKRDFKLKTQLLKPIPALNNRKDLNEIIDVMTQEVLLGQTPPRQALDKAVKSWDNILKEAK